MITDVYYDYYYEWEHEGDYMHVKLYCDYDISSKAALHNYLKSDYRVYVSSFRMKKYYDEVTFELKALNFE